MRPFVAGLIVVWLMALAAACAAQDLVQQEQPPPPNQPGKPEPPPRPDLDGPRAPRPGQPGLDEPPPALPPGPAGREPRPPRPPGPPFDPLLRLIGEQRPELAQRLERLRRESPDLFREVLLQALSARLEDALNAVGATPGVPGAESQPGGPPRDRHGADFGGPGGPPPGGGRGPGELSPELRGRLHELEERHAQLEARSREVAARLAGVRAQGAAEDVQDALREELRNVVREQFDVRSELRQ
ncbi:MAG TPA: hypothetical protein PLP66_05935, partial [Phycisphaerae bacterium]|nr:hypothetical protein [Phycisphaerae bacterium]